MTSHFPKIKSLLQRQNKAEVNAYLLCIIVVTGVGVHMFFQTLWVSWCLSHVLGEQHVLTMDVDGSIHHIEEIQPMYLQLTQID